ncbi:MAG: sulfatase-like hydrolase/transferase [Capsulimonadaceae bacterium]|nr:sulfatase-like hydrolase/transferase [Capsulimonadaceae bacterium]
MPNKSHDLSPQAVPPAAPAIARRTFLKAATGGAALLGMPFLRRSALGATPATHPNILFLVVDQMRAPQWFPQGRALDDLLPSYANLREGAVSFTNAFSAATLCSPSRAALLTGLYTHQNGLFNCVDGEEPPLDTGFKTWGSALRDLGYQTNWYGKWHLSYGDSLDEYGFAGGTFPSPNGGPQKGTTEDAQIVDQFVEWFDGAAGKGPWATTVSLVNPHDIVYYYKYTERYFSDHPAPDAIGTLPANFETEEQLRVKPRLQLAHHLASERKYGALPSTGDGWEHGWLGFMNAYVAFQQLVDRQIGRVLAALDKQPKVRDNTIVVFLSDHGEYGGSHGLRGKGGGVYDEVIRVPLLVKDPTGRWTAQTNVERKQFVSLVDIYGLLLTLASGGNDWRGQPEYAHLSGRLDLAGLLKNPGGRERPYVLHTYDDGGAKSLPGSAAPLPNHVIGIRTREAKLGLYNKWNAGTIDLNRDVEETELYDYGTVRGRLELDDVTRTSPRLLASLRDRLLGEVLPNELRQPLPAGLEPARQRALEKHYEFQKTAKRKHKALEDPSNQAPPTIEGE